MDLRRLGLDTGALVIVHSSLSSLGWVCGASVAVVQALMDVITPSGTLVMPTHSGEYSDPANWEHPPVPDSWQGPIRESMPAFDPQTVPCCGMGRIPETFRSWPGALRSSHPAVSFAAWGRHAGFVTREHSLDHSLGEGSRWLGSIRVEVSPRKPSRTCWITRSVPWGCTGSSP